MSSTIDEIRRFAEQRHYRPATLERWLVLSPFDGAALLQLAQSLRLSDNQLRDLWAWAGEIAARDQHSLAEVLGSAEICSALRQPVGRHDQLKLVKAALRRRRFPQLSANEDRMRVLVRQLNLPAGVRVELPEFLEGDELTIHMGVRDPKTLRLAAAALLAAADSPTCAELFHLLDEAP